MIAIIDYGVGNLRSVQKAFEAVGQQAEVTSDKAVIEAASHVVLPGVGAFGAAAATLRSHGLEDVARAAALSGRPFLGICVGMQLLFDVSFEYGEHAGLGLLPGSVVSFDTTNPLAKVPQIGWNAIEWQKDNSLTAAVPSGSMAYFVHSFYCKPLESSDVLATTFHGIGYASAVQRGNITGVQFHPEKSGDVGLALIRAWAESANV
ncbi:MAG: imidazole glycerol phosphate synthase, glutamine amidotransferase subunit with HisF [Armatimonadota bacterium]